MRRLLLASAILLVTSLAYAEPATVRVSAAPVKEESAGDSGCQVINLYPKLANRVQWSGGCKDGFAHGPGKLEFDIKKMHHLRTPFSRYEGVVERGRPHGEGKLLYAEISYQGGFREGRYHGTGKLETPNFTYKGGWMDGAQHGKGRIVYTYGGSYDGEWRDSQFHGKGVVTYAGGRTVEGNFVMGVLQGEAHATDVIAVEGSDAGPVKPVAGRWIWDPAFSTIVPANLAYQDMTPGQQQTVRNQYPLLDDTDEPPYPLHGKGDIVREVTDLPAYTRENNIKEFKDADGLLRMEAMIDEFGKPTSVKFFWFGNRLVAHMAARRLVNTTFKPALCRGKPCAMVYPFAVNVTTR